MTPCGGSKLMNLPIELRHHIYGLLIHREISDSKPNLLEASTRLRDEIYEWLAGGRFTVHFANQQNEWTSMSRRMVWYEPVLRRAKHIEIDFSFVPHLPSHHLINLCCEVWREECHLQRLHCIVKSPGASTWKRGFLGKLALPHSLPIECKRLLCECLLYPVKVTLANYGITPSCGPITWETPELPPSSTELLPADYYEDHEVNAELLNSLSLDVSTAFRSHSWLSLLCAVREDHNAVAAILTETCDVNLQKATISGRTLFMEAALHGRTHMMHLLLKRLNFQDIRKVLDQRDAEGRTALSQAVFSDQHEMIRFLLAAHADPNVGDSRSMTPLLHAVCNGRTQIAKMLCQTPAVDVRAKDEAGRSMLHFAVTREKPSLISLLMASGQIDVDEVDSNGESPLFYAARCERAVVLSQLLNNHGAAVDLRDKYGRSALSHAAEHNSYRAIDVLLDAGAQSSLKDMAGSTPLFHAIKAGSIAATLRLVRRTRDHTVAVRLAAAMGQSKVKKAVIRLGKDVPLSASSNRRTV